MDKRIRAEFETALSRMLPFWGASSFAELDEAMSRLAKAHALALEHPEWAEEFAARYKEICADKTPFLVEGEALSIADYQQMLELINWDIVSEGDVAYLEAKAVAFRNGLAHRTLFDEYDAARKHHETQDPD